MEDGTYTGTLPTILAEVGLRCKVIVTSGETDHAILEAFGGKVLGHIWDPQEDLLKFDLKVNLSDKNKKGNKMVDSKKDRSLSSGNALWCWLWWRAC